MPATLTPADVTTMGVQAAKQLRNRESAKVKAILAAAGSEGRTRLNAVETRDSDASIALVEAATERLAEIGERATRSDNRTPEQRFADSQRGREWMHHADGGAAGDGRRSEFNRWFAGELRDMTTAGALGGALVPSDYQLYVWDRLAAQAVALKAGPPTIIQTERHSILLPHLLTDATAAWVAENGTITEADPTGEQITVTPTKVATLTKFSRESATDSNPAIADMVANNLQRSIALAIDLGFYEGTGSSNQPTGLKNTSGILTQSMGTNGASPTHLDFLLTALSTLEAQNADMSKVVIVAPARTVNDLFALKDSQNRYLMSSVTAGGASARSIEGVPIFTSNQLTLTETQGTSNAANSVYVYDASQVIVVKAHDVRVEATSEAYFSTDEIGIRCIARVGFAVPNPHAVVRIMGVLA
jgi:HK97 family phage major capsid protein